MDKLFKKQSNDLNLFKIIFIVFLIWFAITFLVYPLVGVFLQTFVQDGSFSFTAIDKILDSERALKSVGNSFLLAVVLTFTVNIVGTFIVLVTEYFDIKGSKILKVGFMSTLVFSGLIVANGWLYLYGQEGVITKFLNNFFPNMNTAWFTGFPAVLLVMTFACTSNHMLFLSNAVRSLDNNTIDAAKNLGDSQWSILKKVVLPTFKPTFLTLIVMTFATGLGAFSAPLMVGGKDFQTIAPMILTFSGRPASRDIAALLSIILGAAQILLLFVITANERKGNYLSISKTKGKLVKQKINNPTANLIVHIVSWALFVIYTLPIVFVILFSFMDTASIAASKLSLSGFTLEHYSKIITNPATYEPLLRSAAFSAFAAVGSVLLMLLLVRWIMQKKSGIFRTAMEYTYYIPWLFPTIMIALGYILTYDRPHPLLIGQSVIGSQWILPIAYMVILLPNTMRYLKSAYYSFDSNLEDASKILGASSMRSFWKVILPALMPTALALIALNFNSNLAEYNMSAFLFQPGSETLGIIIRANSDPSSTIDAKAINLVYSVLLMVINTLVIYFVYGRGANRTLGGKK
ncbi:ABC transporter permease, partial [Aerococcus sanguinicola]|uniref:ABC transporter permease n=1 Tax=unclassified Aerococcus TaxID=2618060 RepID=UPI0008A269EC|nr:MULTISPECIES: iron ABC transporter permease [unclassified Aerococcus]MDK6233523.1 iron ABC transporter permease [Aerococcus sp. UMB10185]MDK6856079.1 iron ABC transporter permease [Aerococcus sp. UMB7533]OFN01340.1 iron ABC transporter permease [Aerococcus sp. HMSC062A02]OHO46279.1 iron ABC transporter permease [Aerococcus sp. HMSC035B07]